MGRTARCGPSGVGFHIAHDLEPAPVGVLVHQGTVAPNLTLEPDSLRYRSHRRADLASSSITAFDEALLLLGGVILGILRQIAMGALPRSPDDLMAVHILELVQLVSRP